MNLRVPCKWLIVASLMMGRLASAQDWQGSPYGAAQYGAPQYSQAPTQYFAPTESYNYQANYDQSVYDDLLPSRRPMDWGEADPFHQAIRNHLSGTWGRLEYMHGGISHERGTVLSAPLFVPAGVPDPLNPDLPLRAVVDFPDPSKQIPITELNTGILMGFAEAPTTRGLKWRNAQGIRGSFGVPLTDRVEVEGRFWGFEDQYASLNTPRIPNSILEGPNGSNATTLMAVFLTTDNVVGSYGVFYDASFFSEYKSSYKGGDVALVFDWRIPNDRWKLQPMIGYRHEQYGEGLSFGGTFDGRSGLGAVGGPESSSVHSQVLNMRDMMELGLRTEWQRGNLKLGLQERLSFGSNIARGNVTTKNFRAPGEDDPGILVTHADKTTFAPSFDTDAYASLQVNRWLSLRVGYNLNWIGGIGAADKSIVFNQVTGDDDIVRQDVRSKIRYSDRTISSLTLGAEILLP